MKLANIVTKLQETLTSKSRPIDTQRLSKTGKRINVPPGDVDRVYSQTHKKMTQAYYTGFAKVDCPCGVTFLSARDGRGRYPKYHSNACKQKVYRERKKISGDPS